MVVFDVFDTKTSSLKLLTITSVNLRNVQPAAESGRFLDSDNFTQSVSSFKVRFRLHMISLDFSVLIRALSEIMATHANAIINGDQSFLLDWDLPF